ncbi:uncharacterized protein [Nicotiana tomentosiformis]|uniref:uncharacterized protein n=1 Tax=Nicotiana tomentosiformis TaxID=4098 RepID=UPI00388C995C
MEYGGKSASKAEDTERNELDDEERERQSANFLASEGLQRLIREKEELTSKRDQLLVEQDQTILCLSELETKATEAVILEAHLQQSEQEVVTRSQEIGPLRVRFDEAKAKWAEIQNTVLAATDHEVASAERLINLETALNSKSEELAAVVVKNAQIEEKYRKNIDHNRLFSSTVRELDVSLKSARSARMRRKTLEEAKTGIIDIDVEIAKAQELELVAKNGLPTQFYAPGSSDSGSEFSETEEGSEGDDAKDQAGENVEPSVEPSTTPGDADTSLPPSSGDAAI